MTGTLTLHRLNAMDRAAFVTALGGVFEHSPWVAEAAFDDRPFASLDALHAAMVRAMRRAPEERRMALVRAHPELAGETMRQRLLTRHSAEEQGGAGLTALTGDDAKRFDELNRRYRERFGFPFIVAVKEHDKDSILAAFERRLAARPEEEETALGEIAKIARFRLAALIPT